MSHKISYDYQELLAILSKTKNNVDRIFIISQFLIKYNNAYKIYLVKRFKEDKFISKYLKDWNFNNKRYFNSYYYYDNNIYKKFNTHLRKMTYLNIVGTSRVSFGVDRFLNIDCKSCENCYCCIRCSRCVDCSVCTECYNCVSLDYCDNCKDKQLGFDI